MYWDLPSVGEAELGKLEPQTGDSFGMAGFLSFGDASLDRLATADNESSFRDQWLRQGGCENVP